MCRRAEAARKGLGHVPDDLHRRGRAERKADARFARESPGARLAHVARIESCRSPWRELRYGSRDREGGCGRGGARRDHLALAGKNEGCESATSRRVTRRDARRCRRSWTALAVLVAGPSRSLVHYCSVGDFWLEPRER